MQISGVHLALTTREDFGVRHMSEGVYAYKHGIMRELYAPG